MAIQGKQGNPKDKLEEQFKLIDNVTDLYESREKVVQLFNSHAENMSKSNQNKEQDSKY